MFDRQDYVDFRDLPPTQGLDYLKKMYVQACSDMTSSFADGFKRSQKTCLAFLAADLCMRLAKKHQRAIRSELFGVEHSSAHQRVLE